VSDENPRQIWRCTNAFATAGKVPRVVGGGEEVLDDDPILKTHRAHFVLAADRLVERAAPQFEQATAAPNELRTVTPPARRGPGRPPKVKQDTKSEETVAKSDSASTEKTED
jgi:hypothetical protein